MPLSVIVQPKDSRSKVTVTLSIGSGHVALDPTANLCKIAGYAATD